ncbi:sensor histidine kinase [Paenibacillus soyae]|uniref:histidine kinase n=1 Tax=Paenibacillus soyae TaxID=2969249 RepID=A0A9X2MV01_9BACL|nr:sensor histidine kinase [Paenibacillus soyae]MCR2806356.1 sensor histidine kinase [Paenibacillus soyae]
MTALQKPVLQSHIRKHGHRQSRWLFALHIGIVASCLFLLLSYLASLPSYFDYLQSSCFSSSRECSDTTISPLPADWGKSLGFTASGLAALHIGMDLLFFACYALVAVLILLLKPKDVVGSITALALIAFAFGDLAFRQWGGSELLTPLAQSIGMPGFMLFALLFPSGRMTRKWLGAVAVAAFVVRYVPDYLPFSGIHTKHWPLWLSLSWVILFFGTLAYSQFTQYRENDSIEAKQAIRKVAFGFIGAFVALICVNLLLLIWPHLYGNSVFWLDLLVRLTILPIPFSLGAALLKYRLWGVPPIVRKSVVYALLLILVFGIYMATVWYLTLVFQTKSGMYPLIATGLVAVLFSPLKESLDKLVNRILYGKRENPVSFLVGLGDRLKEPHAPEQVLGTVVTTIKEMLRLPHASITILVNGMEREAAAAGSPSEEGAIRFPLVMGGEELGSLIVTPRTPDEPLSAADHKLLQLLGREASRIVHGLKQSLDINRLMQELHSSRERLIYAREEERRTIRNNLHDDLAPRLASLALFASAANKLIRKDPARAEAIAGELESDIRVMVSDIRDFVHNLRPPALDQYGLLGAIRQQAERLMYIQNANGYGERIRFEVSSPDTLPPLPAAVEVAVYRIVSEALANVVKHSKANTCQVTLALQAGPQTEELYVEVMDDGVGIPLANRPASRAQAGGVGLTSIRERAEELGGRSRIGNAEEGGTRVSTWIPVQIHTDWSVVD